MNTENKINNRVFINTMIGVVLFIAAIIFGFSSQSQLKAMEAPYIAVMSVLGTVSLFLLGRSIKDDRIELD